MSTPVLLVDDDDDFRTDFATVLQQRGYEVQLANARTAAEEVWAKHPSLRIALVDLQMPDDVHPPEQSGKVLIRSFAERPNASIAAITAFDGHDNLADVASAGADGFISKSWDSEQQLNAVSFCETWITANSAISAFRKSLELRNPYTSGHCERVRELVRSVLPVMPEVDGTNFDLAACLVAASVHDVGKLAVHDGILVGTRTELTRDERDHMARHVWTGAETLMGLGEAFRHAAEIVLYHHRWFDEPQGVEPMDYPAKGLDGEDAPRGEQIPLEARVLSVADALDAMLSDRSYRPGLPVGAACRELRRRSGRQFCPNVVRAACNMEPERLEDIRRSGRSVDDASLTVFFTDQRLTPGRLSTLLGMLENIYLPDGSAINRLAIKEVTASGVASPARVVLAGQQEEVIAIFEILKKRMDEHSDVEKRIRQLKDRGENVPDPLLLGVSRSIPESIEVKLKTGAVERHDRAD